jgi:hypothetical protein
MLVAAPIAFAALPAVLEAAPAPDPIAATYDELVAATYELERIHDATGDLGGEVLGWVRATVALRKRLVAERGEDLGGAIWRRAMDRHYRWLGTRYNLPDDIGSVEL